VCFGGAERYVAGWPKVGDENVAPERHSGDVRHAHFEGELLARHQLLSVKYTGALRNVDCWPGAVRI
jgi:hypothetical protein